MAIQRVPSIEDLQNQLTDLKGEILELSRALSRGADQAAEDARPYVAEAGARIRGMAKNARDQGQAMVDTVRENPGTASSVAVTAGLLGLAVGYFIGSASNPPPPSRRWHF